MIDYNYEAEMACELLSAHCQFMQINNLYKDPDHLIYDEKLKEVAQEGLFSNTNNGNNSSYGRRSLFQINISSEFIAGQTLRAVRIALRDLVEQMRSTVREHVDQLLIQFGKHSTKCRDTNGVCSFIKQQTTNIVKLQKAIDKELTYFRKLSSDTEKYKERYVNIENDLKRLVYSYTKWIEVPKNEIVDIKAVKVALRSYDVMIKNCHDCEAQLAILENRYRDKDKITQDIMLKTNALLNLINKTVQFLTVISNALKGTFSSLSRLSNDNKNQKILDGINSQYSSDVNQE